MSRHGSATNPPNRFERLHYDFDDAEPVPDEEAPDPKVVYYRDPARRIIATNESPDLGFAASINPYRGCEHACAYCLAPGTLVLRSDLGWMRLGEVKAGDLLAGFDESGSAAAPRKLRVARVEAVWRSQRETLRLIGKNCEVVATPEHRWLDRRGRWLRSDQLRRGQSWRRFDVPPSPEIDVGYRAGYLAGITLGDGTFRYRPGQRSDKRGDPAAWWRVAMKDREPLEHLAETLRQVGIDVAIRSFDGGPRCRTVMWKVETRALGSLRRMHRLLEREPRTPSERRGFVAGFFDAEGHNGDSLRISQVDIGALQRVARYGRSFGFDFELERRTDHASSLRLLGGFHERVRFFAFFRPLITRKRERLFGLKFSTIPEPIVRIEPGPHREVVDIQTSTGTFIAEGLATHNCYARPTHEYLGLSAGLDFETRIFVKERAPELLRAELAAPKWTPQPIAVSGVTDAYQPIERKTQLTRRCLEVLAEFRNPVAVVTKSRLVARDADLLAELARHDAASVSISVTTLDPAVHRAMEPRTPRPALRLAAIEALARAGVPVGVLVAPVVPGLTEHELPRILEAAARAGATHAGYVVLRLPHGTKELIEAWLERAFPDRKQKVLGRLRSLRGGALYDSRFGARQRGTGIFAEQIAQLFETGLRRAGLPQLRQPSLSAAAFRRPAAAKSQLDLF